MAYNNVRYDWNDGVAIIPHVVGLASRNSKRLKNGTVLHTLHYVYMYCTVKRSLTDYGSAQDSGPDSEKEYLSCFDW